MRASLSFCAALGLLGLAHSAWAQAPDESFDPSEFEGDEDEAIVPGLEERFEDTPPPSRSPPPAPAPPERASPPVPRPPPTEVPPTNPAPAVVTESAVREALERRAAATGQGDFDAADVAVQELLEVKRSLGIRNIVVASATVIREARLELDAEQPKRAVALATWAAQLAPDLPGAHWMLLRALIAEDPTQVVQISSAFWDLGASWILRFRNLIAVMSWLAATALGAFVIVALAFACVQLVKYVRYAAHDASERLPGVLGTGELTLVLLILVLLPFALGFGLWVSLVCALAVVVPYQMRKERFVAMGFALVLGATPILLELAAPLVLFHGSDTDVLSASLSETLTAEARGRLEALSEETRQDDQRILALVQAYRARQRGDLEEARAFYANLLELDPTDQRSRNNWAVLAFIAGNVEEARAAFEQAATSELAEPRLNLSLLLADSGQFERADALLLEARSLAPELTTDFTDTESGRASAQRLLEVPLAEDLLWRRLPAADGPEGTALVRQLWVPLGGRTPATWFPVVALFAMICALLVLRRQASLSTPCHRCGRPAARGQAKPLCEQCVSVFVSAVAVEPRMRAAKEAEIRSYQRRRRAFERALSPVGLGLLLGDRPLLGVVLAYCIVFGVVALVALPILSISSWSVYVGAEARQLAFILIGLPVLVLAAFGLRKGIGG